MMPVTWRDTVVCLGIAPFRWKLELFRTGSVGFFIQVGPLYANVCIETAVTQQPAP